MKEEFTKIVQMIQRILEKINYRQAEITLAEKINESVKDITSLIDFDFQTIEDANFISKEKKDSLLITLKQANFLLIDCADMDVTNQPQYKLVIEELNKLIEYLKTECKKIISDKENLNLEVDTIQNFISSFSNDGFISDFSAFENLYIILKKYNVSEEDVYIILSDLVKFNIKKSLEKKEKILHEDVFLEENIEDNELLDETEFEEVVSESEPILEKNEKLSIESFVTDATYYYKACDILESEKEILLEALREFKVKESLVSSYYNVYQQSNSYEDDLMQNIPTDYLKKILLVYIKEYLTQIDLTIEREDFNSKDKSDYIELCIETMAKAINDYELFFGNQLQENAQNEKINDLIFLVNVEAEFDSNQLREHYFRHQILSGLGELMENNFNNSNELEACKVFSKKKGGQGGVGGIRIGYVPLSNNLILVLSVFSRQDGYQNLINIYNNNKDIIEYLIRMSKDVSNRSTLLKLEGAMKIARLDFKNKVYELIDDMNNKRKGGITNG